MSFGQQNNPYGPPPQAGYAYPQQAPYPGQPYAPFPQQGGYHGMPPVPAEMPGITKAARIFMWVITTVHVIVSGLMIAAYVAIKDESGKHTGETVTTRNGDTVDAETAFGLARGFVAFLAILAAVFAVIGIILAIRYAKGGNGVRVGSIVYASFAIISGLFTAPAYGLGLLTLVMAILTIVFCAKRASAEWFQRPRY
ncbi:proline-rich domain-containing protein [Streptomyces sp. CA-181903]|uniref:proline-rich domain-containing protein n=1 Tax=Streptomyces sp. CA-181903 TaxID=3240055 RepID=UPI003D89ECFA